ncbi:choice-of-anchor U domain-containing protein [Thermodesulfobacteriota bacterium]
MFEKANFTEGASFQFTTPDKSGNYRVKLKLVQGFGFVNGPYETRPMFDLFDLRPSRNTAIVTYNRERVTIKNGAIIQGRGKGHLSEGVRAGGQKQLTIENVTFENSGYDSPAIVASGTGITIANCNIKSSNPYRESRHQLKAPIIVNGSDILIDNNIIDSGKGWGCIVAGESDIIISNNHLKTSCALTNHHAISMYEAHHVEIYGNIIEADPGQGILASSIYDSFIHDNSITLKSIEPNAEYSYSQVDAITIKDYRSQATHDVKVYNNDITVYGRHNPKFELFADHEKVMAGILAQGTGPNNVVSNNTISMINVDNEVLLGGINPTALEDQVLIQNNTITSDGFNILLGGYASGGGTFPHNILFLNNTQAKGNNPSNYHTIGFNRGGNITSDKMRFVGTETLNGASLTDIALNNFGDFQFNIGPAVTVTDSNGIPLHGVSVKAVDNYSQLLSEHKTINGLINDMVFSLYTVTGNGYQNKLTINEQGPIELIASSNGTIANQSYPVPPDISIPITLDVTSYPIDIIAESGIYTSPLGTINVVNGEALRVDAYPKPGYAIWDILVDEESVGNLSPYEMQSISSPHTIEILSSARSEFNGDTDTDGIPDVDEMGKYGNDSHYDGNNDGIPDRDQSNVVSFPSSTGSNYLTILIENAGPSFTGFEVFDEAFLDNQISPNGEFPFGQFYFEITGVLPNSPIKLVMYYEGSTTPTSYYKYGPTPSNLNYHWYEFLDDGNVGAVLGSNVITLYLIDGQLGDDDLSVNGTIVDQGGPILFNAATATDATAATDGGGGGGGIFGDIISGSVIGYHLDGITTKGVQVYMPVTQGFKALKGAQEYVRSFAPGLAEFIRNCFDFLEEKADADKEGFLYNIGSHVFPVLGRIAEKSLELLGAEEFMQSAYSNTTISVNKFKELEKKGVAFAPKIVKEIAEPCQEISLTSLVY